MKDKISIKDIEILCTGCMACADTCGPEAISIDYDGSGHLSPSVNSSKCVDCGLCVKVCPAHNDLDIHSQRILTYSAWSTNMSERSGSASGGVFAALAHTVINNGGYVAGAVIDGLEVKHIITNKIGDLALIQGSKYQQGRLDGIYREAKKLLISGNTVLFSGSPCQVAAMILFAGNCKNAEKLITVDFICGGFPSNLPTESFILNCGYKPKRIVSFRDKEKGWKAVGFSYNLKIEDEQGKIHDHGIDNLISRAFISHLTNRDSCLDCKFASINRLSDITIGDFWGYKGNCEQEPYGISLIILRNKGLFNLLISAGIEVYQTEWKEFLRYNPRIVHGKFHYFNCHPLRHYYPYVFKKVSYSLICNLFGTGKPNIIRNLSRSFIAKIKQLDTEEKRKVVDKIINKIR